MTLTGSISGNNFFDINPLITTLCKSSIHFIQLVELMSIIKQITWNGVFCVYFRINSFNFSLNSWDDVIPCISAGSLCAINVNEAINLLLL